MVVVVPTTKEMKESGLSVELSAEKGAIRKAYEGSMKTERRVAAELKERKEDEELQKECKERADGWERQRLDHEERMKNTSAWIGGRSVQGKAKKDAERAKARQEEEEEEERDNIVETRFKTEEEYGQLQRLPPHPASILSTASLDAWVSASEEEVEGKAKEEERRSRKSKGKALKLSRKVGKGKKGLTMRPPSYSQLEKANEDLKKELEEEKENNKKKREKAAWRKRKAAREGRKSGSDKTLRRRSSASDSDTIKDYDDVDEDALLASPPSKFVAKPKQGTPMDAE